MPNYSSNWIIVSCNIDQYMHFSSTQLISFTNFVIIFITYSPSLKLVFGISSQSQSVIRPFNVLILTSFKITMILFMLCCSAILPDSCMKEILPSNHKDNIRICHKLR